MAILRKIQILVLPFLRTPQNKRSKLHHSSTKNQRMKMTIVIGGALPFILRCKLFNHFYEVTYHSNISVSVTKPSFVRLHVSFLKCLSEPTLFKFDTLRSFGLVIISGWHILRRSIRRQSSRNKPSQEKRRVTLTSPMKRIIKLLPALSWQKTGSSGFSSSVQGLSAKDMRKLEGG